VQLGDGTRTEWSFSAHAATQAELVAALRDALDHYAPERAHSTSDLPDLVGSKEACQILGIQKMTLTRWLDPGSGSLGPDRTHMIPPKRINAGPVWVRSDVERFAVEVGRRRQPARRQP
jgi:hypothetical protein